MSLGSRLLMLGSAALGLLALLYLARGFWPFTVDDTFITLRYAKHLAEGLGPVWNPGGPRAEGYTTVSWMALLALPHALGLDALFFAKAGGIACTFGSTLLAARLAFELTEGLDPAARRVAALLPFAFVAAYWPLALHAISGMETALAGLLLTAIVLVSVRHARAPSRAGARALALLSLGCTLTRPEAALACAALLVGQAGMLTRPQRRPFALQLVCYCMLPGALYFAARYAYFGLLFPLPFYVKATGQTRFAGYGEVARFFQPFVWPMPQLGLLAIYGGLRMRVLYPALLGLAAFSLFFVFPAHIMGFESRYLQPIVPTLAALMATGSGKLAARLLATFDEPRRLPVELALALTTWLAIAPFRFPLHEAEARTRWREYGQSLQRAHVALAEILRSARAEALHPSIALLDVGAVGYYGEWFTIDTYGLNDAHVALSRRNDVNYVLEQRPELLAVVSEAAGRYAPLFEWEEPLYREALERGYTQVASYEFLADYHLLVLARKASPLGEIFARARTREELSDASR